MLQTPCISSTNNKIKLGSHIAQYATALTLNKRLMAPRSVEWQKENYWQLLFSVYHNKKQGKPQGEGEYEVRRCMSSWNSSNSFKHQVSEACLLWPSVILHPAGSGNKTKGRKWSEEGSHVLNDAMREISAFHPLEPWRLLCSIHQQAWGEKLNMFSI